MIVFSDMTLNETQGDYSRVKVLMNQDVGDRDWMLRTEASVTTELASFKFVLHFWRNGDVVIHDTDRPLRLDVPDDDLRELSQWCRDSDWKGLKVDERLLKGHAAMEFWNRTFMTGLVDSDLLRKREDEEMSRLAKSQLIEERE